jgi:hypothetical protein
MKTYFYPCTALVSGGGLAGSDAIWPSSFSDPLLIDLAGVDSTTESSTVDGCPDRRTDGETFYSIWEILTKELKYKTNNVCTSLTLENIVADFHRPYIIGDILARWRGASGVRVRA